MVPGARGDSSGERIDGSSWSAAASNIWILYGRTCVRVAANPRMIGPPVRGAKPSRCLGLSCCGRKAVGFTSTYERILTTTVDNLEHIESKMAWLSSVFTCNPGQV